MQIVVIIAIAALVVLIPIRIIMFVHDRRLQNNTDNDDNQLQNFTDRDDYSSAIIFFAWIIGIIGIVGFIALATIHENIIIEIVGVLSSTLFILLLLGLARIIDYLFKIHEETKKISSQLNQIADHVDNCELIHITKTLSYEVQLRVLISVVREKLIFFKYFLRNLGIADVLGDGYNNNQFNQILSALSAFQPNYLSIIV